MVYTCRTPSDRMPYVQPARRSAVRRIMKKDWASPQGVTLEELAYDVCGELKCSMSVGLWAKICSQKKEVPAWQVFEETVKIVSSEVDRRVRLELEALRSGTVGQYIVARQVVDSVNDFLKKNPQFYPVEGAAEKPQKVNVFQWNTRLCSGDLTAAWRQCMRQEAGPAVTPKQFGSLLRRKFTVADYGKYVREGMQVPQGLINKSELVVTSAPTGPVSGTIKAGKKVKAAKPKAVKKAKPQAARRVVKAAEPYMYVAPDNSRPWDGVEVIPQKKRAVRVRDRRQCKAVLTVWGTIMVPVEVDEQWLPSHFLKMEADRLKPVRVWERRVIAHHGCRRLPTPPNPNPAKSFTHWREYVVKRVAKKPVAQAVTEETVDAGKGSKRMPRRLPRADRRMWRSNPVACRVIQSFMKKGLCAASYFAFHEVIDATMGWKFAKIRRHFSKYLREHELPDPNGIIPKAALPTLQRRTRRRMATNKKRPKTNVVAPDRKTVMWNNPDGTQVPFVDYESAYGSASQSEPETADSGDTAVVGAVHEAAAPQVDPPPLPSKWSQLVGRPALPDLALYRSDITKVMKGNETHYWYECYAKGGLIAPTHCGSVPSATDSVATMPFAFEPLRLGDEVSVKATTFKVQERPVVALADGAFTLRWCIDIEDRRPLVSGEPVYGPRGCLAGIVSALVVDNSGRRLIYLETGEVGVCACCQYFDVGVFKYLSTRRSAIKLDGDDAARKQLDVVLRKMDAMILRAQEARKEVHKARKTIPTEIVVEQPRPGASGAPSKKPGKHSATKSGLPRPVKGTVVPKKHAVAPTPGETKSKPQKQTSGSASAGGRSRCGSAAKANNNVPPKDKSTGRRKAVKKHDMSDLNKATVSYGYIPWSKLPFMILKVMIVLACFIRFPMAYAGPQSAIQQVRLGGTMDRYQVPAEVASDERLMSFWNRAMEHPQFNEVFNSCGSSNMTCIVDATHKVVNELYTAFSNYRTSSDAMGQLKRLKELCDNAEKELVASKVMSKTSTYRQFIDKVTGLARSANDFGVENAQLRAKYDALNAEYLSHVRELHKIHNYVWIFNRMWQETSRAAYEATLGKAVEDQPAPTDLDSLTYTQAEATVQKLSQDVQQVVSQKKEAQASLSDVFSVVEWGKDCKAVNRSDITFSHSAMQMVHQHLKSKVRVLHVAHSNVSYDDLSNEEKFVVTAMTKPGACTASFQNAIYGKIWDNFVLDSTSIGTWNGTQLIKGVSHGLTPGFADCPFGVGLVTGRRLGHVVCAVARKESEHRFTAAMHYLSRLASKPFTSYATIAVTGMIGGWRYGMLVGLLAETIRYVAADCGPADYHMVYRNDTNEPSFHYIVSKGACFAYGNDTYEALSVEEEVHVAYERTLVDRASAQCSCSEYGCRGGKGHDVCDERCSCATSCNEGKLFETCMYQTSFPGDHCFLGGLPWGGGGDYVYGAVCLRFDSTANLDVYRVAGTFSDVVMRVRRQRDHEEFLWHLTDSIGSLNDVVGITLVSINRLTTHSHFVVADSALYAGVETSFVENLCYYTDRLHPVNSLSERCVDVRWGFDAEAGKLQYTYHAVQDHAWLVRNFELLSTDYDVVTRVNLTAKVWSPVTSVIVKSTSPRKAVKVDNLCKVDTSAKVASSAVGIYSTEPAVVSVHVSQSGCYVMVNSTNCLVTSGLWHAADATGVVRVFVKCYTAIHAQLGVFGVGSLDTEQRVGIHVGANSDMWSHVASDTATRLHTLVSDLSDSVRGAAKTAMRYVDKVKALLELNPKAIAVVGGLALLSILSLGSLHVVPCAVFGCLAAVAYFTTPVWATNDYTTDDCCLELLAVVLAVVAYLCIPQLTAICHRLVIETGFRCRLRMYRLLELTLYVFALIVVNRYLAFLVLARVITQTVVRAVLDKRNRGSERNEVFEANAVVQYVAPMLVNEFQLLSDGEPFQPVYGVTIEGTGAGWSLSKKKDSIRWDGESEALSIDKVLRECSEADLRKPIGVFKKGNFVGKVYFSVPVRVAHVLPPLKGEFAIGDLVYMQKPPPKVKKVNDIAYVKLFNGHYSTCYATVDRGVVCVKPLRPTSKYNSGEVVIVYTKSGFFPICLPISGKFRASEWYHTATGEKPLNAAIIEGFMPSNKRYPRKKGANIDPWSSSFYADIYAALPEEPTKADWERVGSTWKQYLEVEADVDEEDEVESGVDEDETPVHIERRIDEETSRNSRAWVTELIAKPYGDANPAMTMRELFDPSSLLAANEAMRESWMHESGGWGLKPPMRCLDSTLHRYDFHPICWLSKECTSCHRKGQMARNAVAEIHLTQPFDREFDWHIMDRFAFESWWAMKLDRTYTYNDFLNVCKDAVSALELDGHVKEHAHMVASCFRNFVSIAGDRLCLNPSGEKYATSLHDMPYMTFKCPRGAYYLTLNDSSDELARVGPTIDVRNWTTEKLRAFSMFARKMCLFAWNIHTTDTVRLAKILDALVLNTVDFGQIWLSIEMPSKATDSAVAVLRQYGMIEDVNSVYFIESKFATTVTKASALTKQYIAEWANVVTADFAFTDVTSTGRVKEKVYNVENPSLPTPIGVENRTSIFMMETWGQRASGFIHDGSVKTSYHCTNGNDIIVNLPASECGDDGAGCDTLKCILSNVDRDEVADTVQYGRQVFLDVPKEGCIYLTSSPCTKQWTYLKCVRTKTKKTDREGCYFNMFIPININFEERSYTYREDLSLSGLSGAPIVAADGSIVGVYGIRDTITFKETGPTPVFEGYGVFSAERTETKLRATFFAKAAEEFVRSPNDRKYHKLVAPTGTGKSTSFVAQLAKALLGASITTANVRVVQPTEIAAGNCYNQVKLALQQVLGSSAQKCTLMLSYAERSTKVGQKWGSGAIKIEISTAGKCLATVDWHNLDNSSAFSYMLIDEAHEVSQHADVGSLFVLTSSTHFKHKVCYMTATPSSFLPGEELAKDTKIQAPSKPIRDLELTEHSTESELDYKSTMVIRSKDLGVTVPYTHPFAWSVPLDEVRNKRILVFVPARDTCHRLADSIATTYKGILKTAYLHAPMGVSEVAVLPDSCIIFCTAFASTAITIPHCAGVIDFCMDYHSFSAITKTDSGINYDCKLVPETITRNESQQRRGRTGRTCEGFYAAPSRVNFSDEVASGSYWGEVFFNCLIKMNRAASGALMRLLQTGNSAAMEAATYDWLLPAHLNSYLQKKAYHYDKIGAWNSLYSKLDAKLEAVRDFDGDQLYWYLTLYIPRVLMEMMTAVEVRKAVVGSVDLDTFKNFVHEHCMIVESFEEAFREGGAKMNVMARSFKTSISPADIVKDLLRNNQAGPVKTIQAMLSGWFAKGMITADERDAVNDIINNRWDGKKQKGDSEREGATIRPSMSGISPCEEIEPCAIPVPERVQREWDEDRERILSQPSTSDAAIEPGNAQMEELDSLATLSITLLGAAILGGGSYAISLEYAHRETARTVTRMASCDSIALAGAMKKIAEVPPEAPSWVKMATDKICYALRKALEFCKKDVLRYLQSVLKFFGKGFEDMWARVHTTNDSALVLHLEQFLLAVGAVAAPIGGVATLLSGGLGALLGSISGVLNAELGYSMTSAVVGVTTMVVASCAGQGGLIALGATTMMAWLGATLFCQPNIDTAARERICRAKQGISLLAGLAGGIGAQLTLRPMAMALLAGATVEMGPRSLMTQMIRESVSPLSTVPQAGAMAGVLMVKHIYRAFVDSNGPPVDKVSLIIEAANIGWQFKSNPITIISAVAVGIGLVAVRSCLTKNAWWRDLTVMSIIKNDKVMNQVADQSWFDELTGVNAIDGLIDCGLAIAGLVINPMSIISVVVNVVSDFACERLSGRVPDDQMLSLTAHIKHAFATWTGVGPLTAIVSAAFKAASCFYDTMRLWGPTERRDAETVGNNLATWTAEAWNSFCGFPVVKNVVEWTNKAWHTIREWFGNAWDWLLSLFGGWKYDRGLTASIYDSLPEGLKTYCSRNGISDSRLREVTVTALYGARDQKSDDLGENILVRAGRSIASNIAEGVMKEAKSLIVSKANPIKWIRNCVGCVDLDIVKNLKHDCNDSCRLMVTPNELCDDDILLLEEVAQLNFGCYKCYLINGLGLEGDALSLELQKLFTGLLSLYANVSHDTATEWMQKATPGLIEAKPGLSGCTTVIDQLRLLGAAHKLNVYYERLVILNDPGVLIGAIATDDPAQAIEAVFADKAERQEVTLPIRYAARDVAAALRDSRAAVLPAFATHRTPEVMGQFPDMSLVDSLSDATMWWSIHSKLPIGVFYMSIDDISTLAGTVAKVCSKGANSVCLDLKASQAETMGVTVNSLTIDITYNYVPDFVQITFTLKGDITFVGKAVPSGGTLVLFLRGSTNGTTGFMYATGAARSAVMPFIRNLLSLTILGGGLDVKPLEPEAAGECVMSYFDAVPLYLVASVARLKDAVHQATKQYRNQSKIQAAVGLVVQKIIETVGRKYEAVRIEDSSFYKGKDLRSLIKFPTALVNIQGVTAGRIDIPCRESEDTIPFWWAPSYVKLSPEEGQTTYDEIAYPVEVIMQKRWCDGLHPIYWAASTTKTQVINSISDATRHGHYMSVYTGYNVYIRRSTGTEWSTINGGCGCSLTFSLAGVKQVRCGHTVPREVIKRDTGVGKKWLFLNKNPDEYESPEEEKYCCVSSTVQARTGLDPAPSSTIGMILGAEKLDSDAMMGVINRWFHHATKWARAALAVPPEPERQWASPPPLASVRLPVSIQHPLNFSRDVHVDLPSAARTAERMLPGATEMVDEELDMICVEAEEPVKEALISFKNARRNKLLSDVPVSHAPWLCGSQEISKKAPNYWTKLSDGNMHIYKPGNVDYQALRKQCMDTYKYLGGLAKRDYDAYGYYDRVCLPSRKNVEGVYCSRAALKMEQLFASDPAFFERHENIIDPACGYGGFEQYLTWRFKNGSPRALYYSSLLRLGNSTAAPAVELMQEHNSNARCIAVNVTGGSGDLRDPGVNNNIQGVIRNNNVTLLMLDVSEVFGDPDREVNWWTKQPLGKLKPLLGSVQKLIAALPNGADFLCKMVWGSEKTAMLVHELTKHFQSVRVRKLATSKVVSREYYMFCQGKRSIVASFKRAKLLSDSVAEVVRQDLVRAKNIYTTRGKYANRPANYDWFTPSSGRVLYKLLDSSDDLPAGGDIQIPYVTTHRCPLHDAGVRHDSCAFNCKLGFYDVEHLVSQTWPINWTRKIALIRQYTRMINNLADPVKPRRIMFDFSVRNDTFEQLKSIGRYRTKDKTGSIKHTTNELISSFMKDVCGITWKNATYGHTQQDRASVLAAIKKRLDKDSGQPDQLCLKKFAKAVKLLTSSFGNSLKGTLGYATKEQVIAMMNAKGSTGILDPCANLEQFCEKVPNWYELCFSERIKPWELGKETGEYMSVRLKPEPKGRKDVDEEGRLTYDPRTVTDDQLEAGSNLTPRFIQFADALTRLAHMIVVGPLLLAHNKCKLYKTSVSGLPPHIQGKVARALWDMHESDQNRLLKTGDNPEFGVSIEPNDVWHSKYGKYETVAQEVFNKTGGLMRGTLNSTKNLVSSNVDLGLDGLLVTDCRVNNYRHFVLIEAGKPVPEYECSVYVYASEAHRALKLVEMRQDVIAYQNGSLVEDSDLWGREAAGLGLDFSSLDATITKAERMVTANEWASYYKNPRMAQAVISCARFTTDAVCLNDNGDIWVRSGQRGSGEIWTSIDNSYIVAALVYCAISECFGVSLEELLTPIGSIKCKVASDPGKLPMSDKHPFKFAAAKSGNPLPRGGTCFLAAGPDHLNREVKVFEFGAIPVLVDGDDVTIYSDKKKVRRLAKYLNAPNNFLAQMRKAIRSGTESGAKVFNTFGELDFCSHTYSPTFVGKGANRWPCLSKSNGSDCVQTLKLAREYGLRIEMMPSRKSVHCLSKLMMTLKTSTSKWNPEDTKPGGCLDITQSKLISYLLLYPHHRWVRFACCIMLSVTGEESARMTELARRFGETGHQLLTVRKNMSKVLSSLYSLYGVTSLSDIGYREYDLDQQDLKVIRFNAGLMRRTSPVTRTAFIETSFRWLLTQRMVSVVPLTYDPYLFKSYVRFANLNEVEFEAEGETWLESYVRRVLHAARAAVASAIPLAA